MDIPQAWRWIIRPRRLSRLIGVVAATATVCALVLATAAPSSSASLTVPRLAWSDCGDGFDCTTAHVPLDYDQPSGRAIDLALIRLPATDRAHRIGSLFVNPGGPGNSGVQFVREAARASYPVQVRARFDIVGFDPRGVGASTPVQCFANESERQQFFADYNVVPVNATELSTQVNKVADLARRCQTRVGWLLPHLSTANVARDLDLLRRAVGDTRLSYIGYSYGTYLGATYANMFPNTVRALALDANSDPPAYATGPRQSVPFVRINAHIAASETLQQFFILCARAGAQCDFADGGNPEQKFATLARRLQAMPLILPDGQRVGYAELVDFTLQKLYRAADWAIGAATLQQLYLITNPRASSTTAALSATASDDPPLTNVQEALFGNACSDTSNPNDPFDYSDLAARADSRAPYVGAFWTYLTLPCAVWPARDADRYVGPWHVRAAHPALILNTRFDPAADHSNAIHMTELLAGSRLVTVEGWGHTARDTNSACADAILERYLLDQTLPRPDTHCQPGIVPFTTG